MYGCLQRNIDLAFSSTWLRPQLKAIEELKDKAKSGAKLETTQYKKIETEVEIRKELVAAIEAAGGEVE